MKPPLRAPRPVQDSVGIDIHGDVSGAQAAPTKARGQLELGHAARPPPRSCRRRAIPIGLGLGQTTDSIDWVGALFHSFGAELVDAKGNIIVKSNDAVKQVLEYMQRLVKVMPQDVFAWDDASNNKYIISGQGSMIMNPPSAYAVAKRDNPKVAEQLYDVPDADAARRAASRPTCPSSGASGTSRRTSPRRRACSSHLLQRANVEKIVDGEHRLRHPVVREHAQLQDLGAGGAAEGRGVPLPAAQGPDAVDRLRAGAGQHRRSRCTRRRS